MSLELFALLYAFIFRWVPRFGSLKTIPGGNGRPILLVHGYLNNAWVWIFMKRKLAKAGLGPIYLINLGFPFLSIQTYAKRVQRKAKQICRETRTDDLILIGHSMGGVVSALYASELAPQWTVSDVIMIASPIEGTPVARLALGRNAREMQKDSPLLKELREKMAQRPEIRFYQVATLCDQLVVPGISAGRLVKPERRLILDNLGHASTLFSARVADWVIRSLSKPH